MDRYEATVRIFVALIGQGMALETAKNHAIVYANTLKIEVG